VFSIYVKKEKKIFYGLAKLIKKRVACKKKKVEVHFKHTFLSIYNHKKLFRFKMISYLKNSLIPAYIWCQFPEPLLTYH